MFTCIFPTSHKFTFLDFQNWWMSEVCSLEYQCTAWSIPPETSVRLFWLLLLLWPLQHRSQREVYSSLNEDTSLITKITLWSTSVKWQRWYKAESNMVLLAKISNSSYPVSVAGDFAYHHPLVACSVRTVEVCCWLANTSSHNCLLFTSPILMSYVAAQLLKLFSTCKAFFSYDSCPKCPFWNSCFCNWVPLLLAFPWNSILSCLPSVNSHSSFCSCPYALSLQIQSETLRTKRMISFVKNKKKTQLKSPYDLTSPWLLYRKAFANFDCETYGQ